VGSATGSNSNSNSNSSTISGASSTGSLTDTDTKIVEVPAASIPADEPLTVRGYAYSGGGRGIIRVDVSIDGGRTWKSADLLEGHEQPLDRAWAWTMWECDFDLPSEKTIFPSTSADGASSATVTNNHHSDKNDARSTELDEDPTHQLEIICKAVDAAHNVQPDSVDGVWNLRGINNNAWHRVVGKIVPPEPEEEEDEQ